MRVSDVIPFVSWIRRYNSAWLVGDAIAGITVAMLLIPQVSCVLILGISICQACWSSPRVRTLLCGIRCRYIVINLTTNYSVLFATSKDVAVGPTAVLSQVNPF
jgi:sodium-independent sulfate anion transporter 11